MRDLAAFVAEEMAQRGDPGKARQMAAYLKTDMPFYGVQKKGRVEVLRAAKKRFLISSNDDYRAAIEALWAQPHREEKYLAVGIARHYTSFISSENLDLYRKLIVDGAWWDLVDDVAINLVGIAYLAERDTMEPIIEAWVDDEFMWLRRTSLIAPIKHKKDTDHVMLFDHCLRRAHESEFFIRKAIGWTLREYAKTEPDRVREFVLQHRDRWSGLSFREATKHLEVS
jgi:3-methyladenine DNA glycosylase AlkD